MNGNKSKKIIIAISSFFVAVSCFGATTYAWFAVANAGKVENYEMTMGSGTEINTGLLVSTPELAKKYKLDVGEIYYPDSGNITYDMLVEFGLVEPNGYLNTCSAAYDDEWLNGETENKKPIFSKIPSLNDQKGKRKIIESEKDMYYIQFDLYFKSNRGMYLYLDKTTSILPDYDKNKVSARLNDEVEEDELNQITKSLRVSFYSESNYLIYEPNPTFDENGEKEKTAYFGRMDAEPQNGYFDYYDGKEILYGRYDDNSKIVYSDDAAATGNVVTKKSNCFIGNTYTGVEAVDIPASEANGINGYYENSYSLLEMSNKEEDKEHKFAITYVSGKEDQPASKVTVSLWVEGWDRDSILYPETSAFNTNLVFGGQTPR